MAAFKNEPTKTGQLIYRGVSELLLDAEDTKNPRREIRIGEGPSEPVAIGVAQFRAMT
jgi:hypothetical protein